MGLRKLDAIAVEEDGVVETLRFSLPGDLFKALTTTATLERDKCFPVGHA